MQKGYLKEIFQYITQVAMLLQQLELATELSSNKIHDQCDLSMQVDQLKQSIHLGKTSGAVTIFCYCPSCFDMKL